MNSIVPSEDGRGKELPPPRHHLEFNQDKAILQTTANSLLDVRARRVCIVLSEHGRARRPRRTLHNVKFITETLPDHQAAGDKVQEQKMSCRQWRIFAYDEYFFANRQHGLNE